MKTYLRIFLVLIATILIPVGVAFWKGPDSFLFAWVLNLMLMTSIVALTQGRGLALKSSYYDSRSWEHGGKIYQKIGINWFRKLLVWIGWEKLNKPANPVKKTLAALQHLEYGTRLSEFGHSVIFCIVLVITVWVGFRYGLSGTLWLVGLNVLLNLYPVALQRYNRPRLRSIIRSVGKGGEVH